MKLAKKNYNMFGKMVYLVGINQHNEKVFLEAPSWDCGWYWGFGYLETYTNNRNIQGSKDISSHSHFQNFDFDNCILNDMHTLKSCVLSLSELNELKTLMQLAKKLGSEAQQTKSKEYINLTDIHKQIIDLLS